MKVTLISIFVEVVLLVLAVFVFCVLYNWLVKRESLRTALLNRLLDFVAIFGRFVYLIIIVAVVYIIYSVFFE